MRSSKSLSLPRFYAPDVDPSKADATLPADESHHLVRVMRLGVGDDVSVFDGLGHEFHARVVRADRNETVVALGAPFPPAAGAARVDDARAGRSEGRQDGRCGARRDDGWGGANHADCHGALPGESSGARSRARARTLAARRGRVRQAVPAGGVTRHRSGLCVWRVGVHAGTRTSADVRRAFSRGCRRRIASRGSSRIADCGRVRGGAGRWVDAGRAGGGRVSRLRARQPRSDDFAR